MLHFLSDNEPPEITCPVDMERTTERNKRFAIVEYDAPKIIDYAGSSTTFFCTEESGSKFRAKPVVDVHTIVCTATDQYGNSDECEFHIEVTGGYR